MDSRVPRPWTAYEIDTLKSLAGKRSTSQIAKELDRTMGSIIQKAFDLKLRLKLKPLSGAGADPIAQDENRDEGSGESHDNDGKNRG